MTRSQLWQVLAPYALAVCACGGQIALGGQEDDGGTPSNGSSSSSSDASGSSSGFPSGSSSGSGSSGGGSVSDGGSGSSAVADSGSALDAPSIPAPDGGICAPGAQQCSGTSILTCGSDGQWGPPWPCATGTCSGNACAGSTTTGTSCQAGGDGLTNCGANKESCCTSLEVAGGSFYRVYDAVGIDGGIEVASGGGPTGESGPTILSGFRLDKYQVTVGRFRQFASAWTGGYVPAAGSGKHIHLNGGLGLQKIESPGGYETGWLASDDGAVNPTDANLACDDPNYATWTPSPGDNETRPMNCVSWVAAFAFCIWDGGFLPSDPEREYAAAGGSQQREYPWGATQPGTGDQYAIYGFHDFGSDTDYCYFPGGTPAVCTGVTNIAPVGTATSGAGLWGQLDLAGNLSEWNMDWMPPQQEAGTYPQVCVNCAYLTGTTYSRMLRGGPFGGGWGASELASSGASNVSPPKDDYQVGFRCARSP